MFIPKFIYYILAHLKLNLYNHNYGEKINKISGQLPKTAYIYRKTEDLMSNESHEHYHDDGYLVPSPRYFGLKLFPGFET